MRKWLCLRQSDEDSLWTDFLVKQLLRSKKGCTLCRNLIDGTVEETFLTIPSTKTISSMMVALLHVGLVGALGVRLVYAYHVPISRTV